MHPGWIAAWVLGACLVAATAVLGYFAWWHITFNRTCFAHVDERGHPVGGARYEAEERHCLEWMPADATVLEIGGRYGFMSSHIGRRLRDPTQHVVVEPDPTLREVIAANRLRNKDVYTHVSGTLSAMPMRFHADGNASRTDPAAGEVEVPRFDLADLEAYVNQPFDALVVDCEGCLERMLRDYPALLRELRYIQFELDQKGRCDYAWVQGQLEAAGLAQVHREKGWFGPEHRVFAR